MQSAIGENNRLQLTGQQFPSHTGGFIDIAAPNAKVAINHRRVVESEKLFPGRCAIFLDNLNFSLDELRSQLARICDRRRTADELRIRTVELRDPSQSSKHVRKMAPEYAAISVQFIQNDIAQILEQPHPLSVVR